ncbi:class II aldolase/adducin family protein [Novosphingobium colocasiae]
MTRSARNVAQELGAGHAIVLRGNGVVVVGESLEQAVTLTWFLEDAARIERDVRMMGLDPQAGRLDTQETQARQVWAGDVISRMWTWLNRHDRP